MSLDDGLDTPKPRKQLLQFAVECERKLRKNDHKTEWVRLPVEALVRKLEIELEEFKVALQYEGATEAMNECVDIANFAMMLWDRLQQPVTMPRGQDWKPEKQPTDAAEEFHNKQNRTPVNIGTWHRQGTWMNGNEPVSAMFRNNEDGHVYFEDVSAVREHKLKIAPKEVIDFLK